MPGNRIAAATRVANPASTPNRNAHSARRRRRRPSSFASRLRSAQHRQRAIGQRALALDQPLRQIPGHGVDHLDHVAGFRQHLAAVAGVLQEAIDALVAPHRDMRDRVDPQPRRLAPADAAVEHIDLGRHFLEDRIQRLVQQFKSRDLGVVQIDHHAGAFGLIDPRLAQRILQPAGRLRRLGLGRPPDDLDLAFPTPHGRNLATG